MVDFLFIPGSGRDERLGRQVLLGRPGTTLIAPRQNHLAGLLAHLTAQLTATGPLAPPIGDIVLVGHGLETGEYFIPLSRTLASPANFEQADTANTSNAVRITAPLLTPAGGGPMATVTVRLKGCNIGRAQPFVAKLQQAMLPNGGTLNMTAPLHFYEFHFIRGGAVEFLAHKFILKVKQPFKNTTGGPTARAALLAAFAAANFSYLDGTPIPATAWAGFVPSQIHPPRAQWKQSFDMQVSLNPAVGTQVNVAMHREYRYETTPFSWTWRAPNPGNHAAQIALLKATLPQGTVNGRQMYDPSYAWPLYERYGYSSIDDFVDNLDWNVTFSGGTLRFTSTRHEYTVMLPITDPPAPPPPPPAPAPPPVLRFYNFYPTSTSPPAALLIDETNAALFLIL